jgi:ribosomal protein L12E/L44/L45/RPP1/RPP2
MEEMIKTVAEKAGISPEQAKTAIETVVGLLKDKVPAPMQGILDSVLGGKDAAADAAGSAADAAKGALGGIAGKLGL